MCTIKNIKKSINIKIIIIYLYYDTFCTVCIYIYMHTNNKKYVIALISAVFSLIL